MFCTNCGKELPDGSKFCPSCGTAVEEKTAHIFEPEPAPDIAAETPTTESAGNNDPSLYGSKPFSSVGQEAANASLETVVGKNSGYYLQEFKKVEAGEKTKFNWAAFFFSAFFCLYRKCGELFKKYFLIPLILILAASIVTTIGTVKFSLTVMAVGGAASAVGSIWAFISCIRIGKNFNRLYYQHCKELLTTENHKRYGTSVVSAFLLAIVLIVLTSIVSIVATIGAFGGDSTSDAAIKTVKTGYLGEYTDVTVEEIVNYAFTLSDNPADITWDGGSTDDGDLIVEARYTDESGAVTKLQFRMLSDDTFRYGGMTNLSDLKEAVEYLNTIYYLYYMDGVTDEESANAVVNKLNQVSCGAVLCGASASYEGDRENLYQDAFNMEALPATAANYIGLLDSGLNSIDISGDWQDSWSERCTMSIYDMGDNYYSVYVSWASSATDYSEWTFSGYYDEADGILNYNDGLWVSYSEDEFGETHEWIELDHMEGVLIYDDNILYWTDFTSLEYDYDFGSTNMKFTKIS